MYETFTHEIIQNKIFLISTDVNKILKIPQHNLILNAEK